MASGFSCNVYQRKETAKAKYPCVSISRGSLQFHSIGSSIGIVGREELEEEKSRKANGRKRGEENKNRRGRKEEEAEAAAWYVTFLLLLLLLPFFFFQ